MSADDLLTTPLGFVEEVLGMPLYDWQARVLQHLPKSRGPKARRINIAVRTPNGAGKDDRIIAGSVYWWLAMHKRGKVVITTKSELQLDEQTKPAIERHKEKFEGWTSVSSPRYELTTPTGGKCIAFVTKQAARVEGWHKEDDIDGPLLLIVNEAKSVDEEIFTGLDRCTPNCLMYVSSPGPKHGRFYETDTKLAKDWIHIQAGLVDCPHIPKERIDYVIATWKEDHPVTRSTLHGEWMEQEDEDQYAISASNLDACEASPPKHRTGLRLGFCDFGAGKAEHVFAVRDGNKAEIAAVWINKDKEASAGRFIREFRKSGLKPEQIWCDAADKEMADLLAASGWTINRQNFGADARQKEIYKSWSAEAWIELGFALGKREILIPFDDKVLRAQLTTRKKDITSGGKLCIEDKYDMAKPPRNLPSPDRADAICGVFNVYDYSQISKEPFRIPRDWMEQVENDEQYKVVEELGAFAGS